MWPLARRYPAATDSAHTPAKKPSAETEGFSQDLCAYARTDFGQDLVQGGPAGGLPAPDFLVCSTNICKTVIKWYEVVARRYDVPLFVVDTPFLHDGLTPELVDYTVSQFKDFEAFLSEMTGRPFDRDRLRETIAQWVNERPSWFM